MSTVKNLNNFPFAAIIGQAEMKLALQLNVIDPKIAAKGKLFKFLTVDIIFFP